MLEVQMQELLLTPKNINNNDDDEEIVKNNDVVLAPTLVAVQDYPSEGIPHLQDDDDDEDIDVDEGIEISSSEVDSGEEDILEGPPQQAIQLNSGDGENL